ncbi:hypothetical protein [Cellulosimicrobium sp. NPDC057127]
MKVKDHARPATHPFNGRADTRAVAARIRASASDLIGETGTWQLPVVAA